jgi:hypothetical protein
MNEASSNAIQKRTALISELIETEEHYVEDLHILIEVEKYCIPKWLHVLSV